MFLRESIETCSSPESIMPENVVILRRYQRLNKHGDESLIYLCLCFSRTSLRHVGDMKRLGLLLSCDSSLNKNSNRPAMRYVESRDYSLCSTQMQKSTYLSSKVSVLYFTVYLYALNTAEGVPEFLMGCKL